MKAILRTSHPAVKRTDLFYGALLIAILPPGFLVDILPLTHLLDHIMEIKFRCSVHTASNWYPSKSVLFIRGMWEVYPVRGQAVLIEPNDYPTLIRAIKGK